MRTDHVSSAFDSQLAYIAVARHLVYPIGIFSASSRRAQVTSQLSVLYGFVLMCNHLLDSIEQVTRSRLKASRLSKAISTLKHYKQGNCVLGPAIQVQKQRPSGEWLSDSRNSRRACSTNNANTVLPPKSHEILESTSSKSYIGLLDAMIGTAQMPPFSPQSYHKFRRSS